MALTDCCERVEPPEAGVEPLLDDGVVVPFELELDDAPLEPVAEPEPDDETAAGQPRRWSAASCFFAAATSRCRPQGSAPPTSAAAWPS